MSVIYFHSTDCWNAHVYAFIFHYILNIFSIPSSIMLFPFTPFAATIYDFTRNVSKSTTIFRLEKQKQDQQDVYLYFPNSAPHNFSFDSFAIGDRRWLQTTTTTPSASTVGCGSVSCYSHARYYNPTRQCLYIDILLTALDIMFL